MVPSVPQLLFRHIAMGTNKSLSDVNIPASLDSLSPLSWARTGRTLAAASDVVVLPFWHAALAPALTGVARAAKKHGVKKVFALMHNASSHDGNAMHKALTTRFLGCADGVFTLSQPVSTSQGGSPTPSFTHCTTITSGRCARGSDGTQHRQGPRGAFVF